MCNEYRFKQTLDQVLVEFSQLNLPLVFPAGAPNIEPRDSIRPTDPAPVVTAGPDGTAELRQLRWGFQQPGRPPVINFRSDGRRFGSGRCLVLADGFYEFTGTKYPKSKFLFTPSAAAAQGSGLFCIAGLMRDDRFTLLTQPPGPDLIPFHDRQIVILGKERWRAWLAGADEAQVLTPLPAGALTVTQVR